MPETDGTELLKYCNEHYPSIPKLVITGFASIDNAVISNINKVIYLKTFYKG